MARDAAVAFAALSDAEKQTFLIRLTGSAARLRAAAGTAFNTAEPSNWPDAAKTKIADMKKQLQEAHQGSRKGNGKGKGNWGKSHQYPAPQVISFPNQVQHPPMPQVTPLPQFQQYRPY